IRQSAAEHSLRLGKARGDDASIGFGHLDLAAGDAEKFEVRRRSALRGDRQRATTACSQAVSSGEVQFVSDGSVVARSFEAGDGTVAIKLYLASGGDGIAGGTACNDKSIVAVQRCVRAGGGECRRANYQESEDNDGGGTR